MTATLKHDFKSDKVSFSKGLHGFVKGISNSESIKNSFINIGEIVDWFYIIRFPDTEDVLVAKSSIDLS